MQRIDTYIIEKLKLDKDIKTSDRESDINTVVSLITDMCRIPLSFEEYKDIWKEIENWVIEYSIKNINEIKIFVNLDRLRKKNSGIYDRLKRDNYIKRILEPDKDLDELILHAINNNSKLIASNQKHPSHGKLYSIGTAIAYVLDYCDIYFYMEPKYK